MELKAFSKLYIGFISKSLGGYLIYGICRKEKILFIESKNKCIQILCEYFFFNSIQK